MQERDGISRGAGAIKRLDVRCLAGKQRRLEVDDCRKDGDGEYQYQPFQIVIPEEAGKVQDQYDNGDDVKNEH
jgi:hypothetical protein